MNAQTLVASVGRALAELARTPSRRPVAGAAIVDRQQRVLLAYSTYARQGWHLPKGGVDEGEDVPTAAMREAHEETGASGWLIPSLPWFPLGPASTFRQSLGFGSPRHEGGEGISLAARDLLLAAARRAGVEEPVFERHKLALFDALATTRVLWRTEPTYCVLAWREGEPRQMPETAAPPRWVPFQALAQVPRLHGHVKKLLACPGIDAAIAQAAELAATSAGARCGCTASAPSTPPGRSASPRRRTPRAR